MAEYIEREDAIRVVNGQSSLTMTRSGLIDSISKLPAADVVPVVHARWKEMHYEGGILDGTNFDRCSVCGYERVFDDPAFKTVFKYCPNCGAKMDGGNSDEAD